MALIRATNKEVPDIRSRKGKAPVLLPMMLFLPSIVVLGAPDEVHGVVTNVVDGDTIDVQDFGRVRLADIDCPDSMPEGASAKAYAIQWLQNSLVYLDVDNISKTDNYGRYVAVIYLTKPDGSVDISKNFNRMLVDSGHACIWDFKNNEFNPSNWWSSGIIPSTACIK